MDPAIAEVIDTVERVQKALDHLLVRGLRAAGPDEIRTLEAHRDGLRGAGARYLADALDQLIVRTQESTRDAAKAMFHAQTSLRLFERRMSLRAVSAHWSKTPAETGDDGDTDDA